MKNVLMNDSFPTVDVLKEQEVDANLLFYIGISACSATFVLFLGNVLLK